MWPQGGGFYYPQAPPNNPSVQQQSNPSDWAAKAAQWAHQKSAQEQAFYQQQQQQMLAIQVAHQQQQQQQQLQWQQQQQQQLQQQQQQQQLQQQQQQQQVQQQQQQQQLQQQQEQQQQLQQQQLQQQQQPMIAQQYAQPHSQPQTSVPAYPPHQVPTQSPQAPSTVQPGPPSIGPPQPLFSSPGKQSTPPPQVDHSNQQGPGHIDSKPTMGAQFPYHEDSEFCDFRGSGSRGRQPRGNIRHHGPNRGGGGGRGRPRPFRGANQRGWMQPHRRNQPRNRVPAPRNFMSRSRREAFDTNPVHEEYSQATDSVYPEEMWPENEENDVHPADTFDPGRKFLPRPTREVFDTNPVHEEYPQTADPVYPDEAWTKNTENLAHPTDTWSQVAEKSAEQRRREAEDIDNSLYSKEPDDTFHHSSEVELPPKQKDHPPAFKLAPDISNIDREDELLYSSSPTPSSNAPTVASLQTSSEGVGAIPGLGEPVSDVPESAPPKEKPMESSNAQKMIASLGKLMTELQGLKGFPSIIKPKLQQSRVSEQDLSDQAKKKAAALLANESDSDGEPEALHETENPPVVEQEYVDEIKPAEPAVAREFDGYNVKPQVYNTYTQEGGYPQPPPHAQNNFRDQYPHEPIENYNNRDYGYSNRNQPPPENYFPPERDRFHDHVEDRSSYPEKKDWENNRDFGNHGRYHDPEYPPVDRYPPVDEPPRRYPPVDEPPRRYPPVDETPRFPPVDEPPRRYPPVDEPPGRYPPVDETPRRFPPVNEPPRRFPPEPPFVRDGYPSAEPLPVRDRRYSPFPSGPPAERPYPEEEYHKPIPVQDYRAHELLPGKERYHEPERPFSVSQIESIDYGHGGAAPVVNYDHEKDNKIVKSDPLGGYNLPPSVPYFPAGVDPAQAAIIAAAYSVQVGESKRKALPSWLKDELEKIEAKKQKEVAKEKVAQEKLKDRENRANWRDEIESDEDESKKRRSSKKSYRRKSSSPERNTETKIKPKKSKPVVVEDEEEKEIAKILKVRQTLTEVLLEVTDREINLIAQEVLDEENQKPALSFAFKNSNKNPAVTSGNVLAGMSLYDSGSESERDAQSKMSDIEEQQNLPLNPLAVAKAFADTVVDPELGPPSKEHQEWADKLLSDLTPRSRKSSSRKHSKSEEKRSHIDRRSSYESKSSRKSSSEKDKASSSKSRSLSHSSSKSSPSSKTPSLPRTSGMSLAAGFPSTKHVPKPVRARSPSPSKGSSARKRSRRSTKSKSPSPPGRRVSYNKHRSRSKSPVSRSHKKVRGESKSPSRVHKKDRNRSRSPRQKAVRPYEKSNVSSDRKTRSTGPGVRVVTKRK